MNSSRIVVATSYALSLATIVLAILVWAPPVRHLTPNSVFPLLGLIAFGLMWSHYVSDALRRWKRVDDSALGLHFQITSPIVLACLLLHPLLFELQLYLDGLGLPPGSIAAAYPGILERAAILAGAVSLLCFLLFEAHRIYGDRHWWRYVSWANIGAMIAILGHGFILSDAFSGSWFLVVWITYAITFVASVVYTEYSKRRSAA